MENRSLRKTWMALFWAIVLTAFAPGAFAVLTIAAMPSGTTSPANAWDSRPYTWPGNNLELWGRVVQYDGGKALTYTWDFGAGEGSATGTVSSQANIAASHVYAATGSKVATLTVTDVPAGGTHTAMASVYIDVVPQTLDAQKRLAIQRALKYLYMSKAAATVNSCSTNYWNGSGNSARPRAVTGLAVLAFEDYNHRASNPMDQDIYAETVDKGLKYIEAYLRRTSASNTGMTDSDLNGNGYKVYPDNSFLYEQGIEAMAIANSNTPTRTVTCSTSSHIQGWTYMTVLQDMVDWIAFAQKEGTSGYAGGWRYNANDGESDNSVSQWPVLGLIAASQAPWNISAPSWVKSRMPIWISYSQNANGGWGYTAASTPTVARTGGGVIQHSHAGSGGNLANAVAYIGSNWCLQGGSDTQNLGNHYAMYAVKKGLQYAGVTTVSAPTCTINSVGYGGVATDWQNDYDKWLVNRQTSSGTNGIYWPDWQYVTGAQPTAAFGLLVMAPGLTESPPVAVAGPDQEVPPSTTTPTIVVNPVSFDGSASYHTDSTKSIVLYEWDFDFDGITFDVNATGATTTKADGYSLPSGVSSKVFTVGLRVTDNSSPTLTARDTLNVTVSNGNQAPVAVPGGPYGGAVGEDIVLNGTGSYDANSAGGSNPLCGQATPSGCDEIARYQWNLDGDALFGTEDTPPEPEGATPTVNFGSFIGTKTISLKVTDSFGASAMQSSSATTVAVSNLQPLCYVKTVSLYNPLTRVWTHGWKLNLKNEGTSSASSISAILTSIPLGVTVLDGNLAWAGSIPAGSSLQSTDDFRYRFVGAAPDLAAMTWDIELTDNLGARHIIRKIPQGYGACP